MNFGGLLNNKMRHDNYVELNMFFPDHASHIVAPSTIKKRKCLRCKQKFNSSSFSKRLCGHCSDINASVPKHALMQ